MLAPNGSLVLEALGASFENMRPTILQSWETVNAETLQRISCVDFANSIKRYGFNVMAVHRVDLHNELLRLATEGNAAPISLRLDTKVTVTGGERFLHLNNGKRLDADLIIGADGAHSAVREAVLRPHLPRPMNTDLSAFRLLIPTAKLIEHMSQSQALRELYSIKAKGSSIYADTTAEKERHLVWYDCRGGEVQNIVGIHPTRRYDANHTTPKQALLADFRHFSAGLVELLGLAEEVACWPLNEYSPLSHWRSNNVILIGDAAHPMLPFGGQAANQALEDAGALGELLKNIQSEGDLYERLRQFEELRRSRANAIQILSSVRVGMEEKVQARLRDFAAGEKAPSTFEERISHAYNYDVIKECQERLNLL